MQDGVFVLGSFVVDCAYRAGRLPVAGETVLGSSFAMGPGGKGSNQAVAAARAGATVFFQTAVGDDTFGKIGRELWSHEKIDSSFCKTAGTGTGSAAILLEAQSGANSIVVVPGACAELTPKDVEQAAGTVQCTRIFLAQLELPIATVAYGLALAHAAGVTTILNPAPAPVGSLSQQILRTVDYLVPNETEAAALAGISVSDLASAERAARRLQADGAAQVILTLGQKGALLVDEHGQVSHVPAFQLGPVVDTTGAGDAFCGGFAAALSVGASPHEAMRFASATAGLSVLHHGAASAMPSQEQIAAVLASAGMS